MDKENNAVADFLGEFGNKGEIKDPFGKEQVQDPFDKQEIQEEVIEEKKEEKPLPFNKDPKIQKYLDKREREIEERIKSSLVSEPREKEKEIDDYYTRLIGNDTPEKVAMIREAQARDERLLQQAEERAFNRLSQREQESIKADQEAEQELESAFENIEETFDVDISSNSPLAKKTRQEFVSFVEKIAPKDRYGDVVDYPDMTSAWETFSEMKKATQQPSRAKELASRSMARSAETSAKPIQKMDWNQVENFMDNLK